ncbi:hypothetical protein [Streptomyces sp. NPDC006971]|uniref:hypothetical protein n=1 Tax=Streptomyces sp. NPDC006971 TaxID=3154784 RepID=UPI0033EDCB1A
MSMSVALPQVVALASLLSAATGSEPRITETADAIRIEADLPADPSPVTRSAILRALGTADRYGHDRTGNGDVVWAEIYREETQ